VVCRRGWSEGRQNVASPEVDPDEEAQSAGSRGRAHGRGVASGEASTGGLPRRRGSRWALCVRGHREAGSRPHPPGPDAPHPRRLGGVLHRAHPSRPRGVEDAHHHADLAGFQGRPAEGSSKRSRRLHHQTRLDRRGARQGAGADFGAPDPPDPRDRGRGSAGSVRFPLPRGEESPCFHRRVPAPSGNPHRTESACCGSVQSRCGENLRFQPVAERHPVHPGRERDPGAYRGRRRGSGHRRGGQRPRHPRGGAAANLRKVLSGRARSEDEQGHRARTLHREVLGRLAGSRGLGGEPTRRGRSLPAGVPGRGPGSDRGESAGRADGCPG
jgi:hypothetical protein